MKVRSYDLHELFIFISISNLFISKIIFTYKSRPTILNLSISHRELYTLQEATMAIQRLFVTKRESFNLEAQRMLQTLQPVSYTHLSTSPCLFSVQHHDHR